jgi:histidinol-phosphate aminotransferase
MNKFSGQINNPFLNLTACSPGYSAKTAHQKMIKLASNENPLGPGEKVLAAINDARVEVSRYPDPSARELKALLSKKLNVDAEKIILDHGSSELLSVIARVFLAPGGEAIIPAYGFVVYHVATAFSGATPVVTPVTEDWRVDLSAILKAITPKTQVIFIANPGNPTGAFLTKKDIADFLAKVPKQIIVVIDEAYYEYACLHDTYDTLVSCTQQYPNLIVTRTFSKIYGLAGLRVGYAVSDVDIVEVLNRVRLPFNATHLGLVAAKASLEDAAHIKKTTQLFLQGLAQLKQGADVLGLSYLPTAGNFITIDLGRPAMPVYERLLDAGIFVRHLVRYNLPNHLRVTVGLLEENQRFLEALEKILH